MILLPNGQGQTSFSCRYGSSLWHTIKENTRDERDANSIERFFSTNRDRCYWLLFFARTSKCEQVKKRVERDADINPRTDDRRLFRSSQETIQISKCCCFYKFETCSSAAPIHRACRTSSIFRQVVGTKTRKMGKRHHNHQQELRTVRRGRKKEYLLVKKNNKEMW